MEFISDDFIYFSFQNVHILITMGESAPQNRHVLKILDEYFQKGRKYNHLKTENLPYKPLYLSAGSEHLEPDTKYSDLIGAMSAFNCLNLDHYFHIELKFVNSFYVKVPSRI